MALHKESTSETQRLEDKVQRLLYSIHYFMILLMQGEYK